MMIIKSDSDIRLMRKAGEIAGGALRAAGEAIRPGMSTKELDRVVESYIRSHGARPSFKGYGGFPASACISINNVVIHGIPSDQILLKEGDIVSVDVGAYIGGFHGDTANTFPVGKVSPEAMQLIEVTRASLMEAHKLLKNGVRLGDIGHCIESYVQQYGYSPVKDFVGHGIGRALHEDPNVPNFGRAGHGLRLPKGATVAIEPMINEGTDRVIVSNEDGWTVTTADGKLSAHYEHTFYIDETCGHILTLVD
ncbi:MAG: type I methionyl aminopeptidase [Clostridia bacterium]|nr:type I methionyl aminopeptidase [Clostridia bacterium]